MFSVDSIKTIKEVGQQLGKGYVGIIVTISLLLLSDMNADIKQLKDAVNRHEMEISLLKQQQFFSR